MIIIIVLDNKLLYVCASYVAPPLSTILNNNNSFKVTQNRLTKKKIMLS